MLKFSKMISLNPIEKIIIRASKNPRVGGYRNYQSTIKKMIEDEVWGELHTDFALAHLKELAEMYDIKYGTIKQ